MNDFLKERFPKTGEYIEKSFRGERLAKAADIEKIAWVESRSPEDESGVARVAGTWTPDEIAADVEACRRTALKKSR